MGFTVKDPSVYHSDWLGHVLHLVRWVLLELPVPKGSSTCAVKVMIEKRGDYSSNFENIEREILSEFCIIDPVRFEKLELTIKFIDKTHPMNGYPDAIAYTWGSNAPANRDRLEKSQLLSHSLINTKEVNFHRLYFSLRDRSPLRAKDWYMLCTEANYDPNEGFLSRMLDKLGVNLHQYPQQWLLYIDEVQTQLMSKKYRLSELGHALAWLERYANQQQTLPSILQLQLFCNKLALCNHRGDFNKDLINKCFDLVERLHDEEPQLACEAILRLASMSTNYFQFDFMEEDIKKWIAKDVAVAGLKNYGKLQSILGQLKAFVGQPQIAISHFVSALEIFAKLNYQNQAKPEIKQTTQYMIIAQMDAILKSPKDQYTNPLLDRMLANLSHYFGNDSDEDISFRLATSCQDERYDHFLWLRTMVYFPKHFSKSREVYLRQQPNWSAGMDYPWPHILSYRAWLLCDKEETASAERQLESAIDICMNENHGPTLRWIAEVLRTVAQALGLSLSETPSEKTRMQLRNDLEKAHIVYSIFLPNEVQVNI